MAVPIEIVREPGQGAVWFDHIATSQVDDRELVTPNLIEHPGLEMEATYGANAYLLLGGPQCNGFCVPEYLGADAEIVAYRVAGGGGRNVMY